MGNRSTLSGLLLLTILLPGLAGWLLAFLRLKGVLSSSAAMLVALAVLALLVLFALVLFRFLLLTPLSALLARAKTLAAGSQPSPAGPASPWLPAELTTAFDLLEEAVCRSSQKAAMAVTASVIAIEKQKRKLEFILKEFNQGVVLCDGEGRILLFNPAACKLLQGADSMALGVSLYEFCTKAPIDHSLNLLQYRVQSSEQESEESPETSFICAALANGNLLHCRISLLPGSAAWEKATFIMTFADVTQKAHVQGRQANLLQGLVEEFRAPLANLRAAAENLAANPEMAPDLRESFSTVIEQESGAMADSFEAMSRGCRFLVEIAWPMADVFSADLIGCLISRLHEEADVDLTMRGIPLWLRADTHSTLLILDLFARRIAEHCGIREMEMEALLGDRRIYLDFIWQGEPIPHAEIDSWLGLNLAGSVGDLKVGDVLERHGSAVWSQAYRLAGQALFRLPLPASERQWQEMDTSLASLAEFNGFEKNLVPADPLGFREEAALAAQHWVAFDLHATGPVPARGDEIIAIGGVRIKDGLPLEKEHFDSLVNPVRPIPKTARTLYGITDEMVGEKPPAPLVLPRFKAFVGDDLLVVHGQALKLGFIHQRQSLCGLHFGSPCLDIGLLACLLDGLKPGQGLDILARHYGVEIVGRHTVFGDAMTVARIFCRMLPLLEKQGIATVGEVFEAVNRVVHEKI